MCDVGVGRTADDDPSVAQPLSMVEGHVEQVSGQTAGDIHVGEGLHFGIGPAQTARQDGHQLVRDARAGLEQVIEIGTVDDEQLDIGGCDDRSRPWRRFEQPHLAEDLAGAEDGQDELLAVR